MERNEGLSVRLIIIAASLCCLVGCDQSKNDFLDRTEQLAFEYEQCLVSKVLPSDCREIDDEIDLLRLEIKRADNPPRDEQLKAAEELGKWKVKDDWKESIYNQVSSVVSSTMTFEHNLLFSRVFGGLGQDFLEDYNFLIFSDRCEEFADKAFYQRFASIQFPPKGRRPNGNLIFDHAELFFRHDTSCFNIEDILYEPRENDKQPSGFAILSEEQIDLLNENGIRALKYESMEEAEQAQREFLKQMSGP